jgi:UDP-perosamine 4-acetyltransferase
MDTLVIGAGGHGRVVVEILRAAGEANPVGFIDANPSLAGTQVAGIAVLGHLNVLPKVRQRKLRHAIVAIGDNAARESYCRMMTEHGFELINAIHPSAVVSPSAKLGRSVVVAAGAVVGTETTIGDGAIINTGAVVDHECEVSAFAHLCPGALLAGRVRIGQGAFVGLGAKVIQCLSVGAGATVGAGAVVIRDIPPAATAVGVPARIIRRGEERAA